MYLTVYAFVTLYKSLVRFI